MSGLCFGYIYLVFQIRDLLRAVGCRGILLLALPAVCISLCLRRLPGRRLALIRA